MPVANAKRVKYGVRHSPPTPASIIAAATPVNVYLISPGRTLEIRKIHINNRNAAVAQVSIGTGLGVGFVAALPPIQCINGGNDIEIPEDSILNVELGANVTASSSVGAAAPNDILISVEVEEYPGTIG